MTAWVSITPRQWRGPHLSHCKGHVDDECDRWEPTGEGEATQGTLRDRHGVCVGMAAAPLCLRVTPMRPVAMQRSSVSSQPPPNSRR